MHLRLLLAMGLFVGAASIAAAADIVDARVEPVADRYEVDFEVVLDGEPGRLAAIITDYARFADISPTVTTSRVLSGRAGHDARIELRLKPCVLVIFCKTVTKVSDARVAESGMRIEYVVVPALSDFHEAREIVILEDESTADAPRVRFIYSAVLKPKFTVPPFIGPWLIRRQIISDLTVSSQRVEQMLKQANQRP